MSGGVATGSCRAGPQLALDMVSAFGDSRRGPAENAAAHRPAVPVARGRDHRLRERARVRACACVDAWCVVCMCLRVRACVRARARARAVFVFVCARAQARAGLRAAA